MIRFFVYSNLKSWLQEGDNTKDIGAIRTFMIGGVAGAASVFGNTPVDVVKTRMQVSCDRCEDVSLFIIFIFNFEIMHDLSNQIG